MGPEEEPADGLALAELWPVSINGVRGPVYMFLDFVSDCGFRLLAAVGFFNASALQNSVYIYTFMSMQLWYLSIEDLALWLSLDLFFSSDIFI